VSTPDCVFCALVAGRIPARRVYEDAAHVAFFPLKHIEPGHTLLIPRRHVDYVFDMADGDYQALWATAKRIAPAIRTVTGAARVGVAVEGFSVPHVHVHLVPINALNDLNPAREQAIAPERADELAAALGAALGTKSG
jgi:histidine triad (HIT) family protein